MHRDNERRPAGGHSDAPGATSRLPPLRRFAPLAALAVTLGAPAVAEAQRSLGTYSESRRIQGIRPGMPEIPGGFTFCRLQYNSVRMEQAGLGWSTDYPRGDFNLTTRLWELTPTWISRWNNGDPGMAVVRATDPELFRCPFLFTSDVGTAGLNDAEADALRRYFLKGGFLWVDDFWGNAAWNQWERQMHRVLPEYEIVDLPGDHPLLSIVYHVEEVPQIPHMQFWRRTGGQTSERGIESARVNTRAIIDENDRILVFMTHNTDIADGWEREMDNDAYFQLFSPDAYAVGINVLTWMMTH